MMNQANDDCGKDQVTEAPFTALSADDDSVDGKKTERERVLQKPVTPASDSICSIYPQNEFGDPNAISNYLPGDRVTYTRPNGMESDAIVTEIHYVGEEPCYNICILTTNVEKVTHAISLTLSERRGRAAKRFDQFPSKVCRVIADTMTARNVIVALLSVFLLCRSRELAKNLFVTVLVLGGLRSLLKGC